MCDSGYNVGIWYRCTKTGVSGDNQRHVSNIWQAVVVEIINDLKNVLLILRHMGVEYVFVFMQIYIYTTQNRKCCTK
jgi:hypothetical protein